MSLDRYLHALGRYWYVIAVLIAAGALGMVAYVNSSGNTSATASVAVFEPSLVKVAASDQAQVTFDTVLQSRAVAERVIQDQHLSMTPEGLQGRISVKLAKQLVPNIVSPLYEVQVKDPDPKRAVALANDVIAQAKEIFLGLNTVDINEVDAAYAPEEQHLQSQLDAAQSALTTFETKNKAWQLSSQIDAQQSLVNNLRQASLSNPGHSSDSTTPGGNLTTALTQEQAELDRLRGLDDQYSRLSLNVALATAAVNQFATHANDAAIDNNAAAAAAAAAAAKTANQQLDTARTALMKFQAANGIGDLQTNIDQQTQLVTNLRQQSLLANASDTTLKSAIAAENQTLQQLLTLLPTYTQLTTNVAAAQAGLTQLESRKIDTIIGTNAAPAVQIKVLDTAHAQTSTFRSIMFYALGVALGLFVSFLLIYLFAYFDRLPRTAADAREIVGVPVLTRVPPAY